MASFQIQQTLMPSDSPSDVKFEIGHVLFIDIVRYSKLLINAAVMCAIDISKALRSHPELHMRMGVHTGGRAIPLTPLEKDAINGSYVLQYFAITATWAGDNERAMQQLEAGLRALQASEMLSYGALKLFPVR